jgi:hypothetical protein
MVIATLFFFVGITVFKDLVLLFQVFAAVDLPLTTDGLDLLLIVPNEPLLVSTTFLRLTLSFVVGFTFVCFTFGLIIRFCFRFGLVIV